MSVIVFVRVSTALLGAVFNATLIYVTYKQNVCRSFLFYNGFISYQFLLTSPDKKVTCVVSDVISPAPNNYVALVIVACCLCYCVIWTILKTSLFGSEIKDKATQRIFKSLVVILIASVLPLGIYQLFKYILTYIKFTSLELWYATSLTSYTIVFASITDILILYIFSTEYRAAIQRQFFKNVTAFNSGSNMTPVTT
uniref:G-protein coupled receptors family 1 profile domain-containing protein n=1 Tax=Ditylenchus dipsaci TaxID=166011 RepID=A0A915EF22_9BILA